MCVSLKVKMLVIDYDSDSGFSQATMNHTEGLYLTEATTLFSKLSKAFEYTQLEYDPRPKRSFSKSWQKSRFETEPESPPGSRA